MLFRQVAKVPVGEPLCGDDSIAPGLFGMVKGIIGCFKQLFSAFPAVGEPSDTDRYRDGPQQLPAIPHIQQLDVFAHQFRSFPRGVEGRACQDKNKFLSAVPANDVLPASALFRRFPKARKSASPA